MHLTHKIALCLALVATLANAETLSGRVVGVHDGDTITVLDAQKRQHRIRLAQIDAPEKRQPFGERSKQSLSELVFGKQVTADCPTTDRYGRQVCTVFVGNTNANLEQVRRGMAWVYRRYATEKQYFLAEAEAKDAKRGLWVDPNPIPPWEFRHSGKSARVPKDSSRAMLGSCGEKSTCRQMASCEEAKHFLKDCGIKNLDHDGDGVPCESLCRQNKHR
jgi:endonuclease YncB( thermonuclease family)